METLIIIGAVVSTVAVALFPVLLFPDVMLDPPKRTEGDWVAKVWLEWEICRGSTMYRQRFKSQGAATKAAKFRAKLLDRVFLPTHYPAEDMGGNRYSEPFNFAIQFGVRKIAPENPRDGGPIWTTAMPGDPGFTGEHPFAHPVYGSFKEY